MLVFLAPLAQAWKHKVMEASQNLVAIIKMNLLAFYDEARKVAFKTTTIASSFRKTGIWPFNHDAVSLKAFKLAKNTIILAAQPLPAHIPTILMSTPNLAPTTSFTMATTPDPTKRTETEPSEPCGDTAIDDPV